MSLCVTVESTINGQSTTMAQEGCNVFLTCQGQGNTVTWRVFGVRNALTTSNSIRVTVSASLLSFHVNQHIRNNL